MRSIRIIAILLLTITFTTVSLAEEFIVDGIKYSNQDGQTARVEGPENMNYSGKLVIPEKVTYRGTVYDVTSIDRWAFSYCKGLTSVEIPGSITSIGENPFDRCSGLTSIIVKSNNVYDSRDNCNAIIETATNKLISGCQATIIPESVTSIGTQAFSGCTGLTSIEIPQNITSLEKAFTGCTGLKSVQWNATNCEEISDGCWNKSPVENFYFSKNVEVIPKYCCQGLSNITYIEIPSSVTSIGSYAFDECSGINSIEIPSSVTTIGVRAFRGCSKITDITIPQSVTRIDRDAFLDCTSLKSVQWDAIQCNTDYTVYSGEIWGNCPIENFSFGKNVKIIPRNCCYGISTLTSIEVPENVISINDYAFYGCTELKSVQWNAINCESVKSTCWESCPIETFIFSKNVKIIPENCCYGLNRLTSIEIPNSVTTIGVWAFRGCTGLTSIEIPKNITSLGSAFVGCTNLKSIIWNAISCTVNSKCWNNCPISTFIFNDNIENIPNNCCYGLSNITSIIIPSKVVSIGKDAFGGCTGLTSVTWNATNCESLRSDTWNTCPVEKFYFDKNIDIIPENCCYGLKNITSIEIPNSVTSIGASAFSDCTGLTSIEIPHGIVTIGNYAFSGCTGLQSVQWDARNCEEFFKNTWDNCPIKKFNFSQNVETIPDYCCKGLSSITSIEISNNVASIGKYAFNGCSGLVSIDIPQSITSVDVAAFSDCTGLESVQWDATNCESIFNGTWRNCPVRNFYFGKNVEVIPDYCCMGLCGLTSVKIPDSVTSIGRQAFSECTGLTSIEIPQDIVNIRSSAFYGCTGLKLVQWNATNCPSVGSSCWNESSVENFYFGKNVEVVPENCCYGLKWLTSIEIPNSVNTIGAYAFSDCDGLVSIEVPLNVTSIGNYAFHLCDNLETLICYAKNPPVCNTNIFMQKTNSVVYVPCESLSTYKNNSIWGQFNLKCISALPEDNVSEVETAPKEKSVIITWPAEDGADLYTIVITNGGVVVCTLKFDSKGELLSIDYPNTSLRGAVLQSSVSTGEGFRFEIKGLDPETEYNYTISTSSGSIIINEESGTFTTLDHTTKVDSIEAGSLQNAVYISGRTITVEGVDDSSVKIFNSLGQIVRNPIQNAGVYVVTVGNETVKVAVP